DYKDLENVLFEWFKSVSDENVSLSGPMLAIKADELAKKLGHADFSAVERFKHRRGIVCTTVCGESESVNSDVLDDYVTTKLPILLIGYQPRDFFNIDETGLFYKLLPNRTLALKGEECHGGKHSKELIQHMLNCFERKQDTAIILHQGITFAHSAWHKVSSKCISTCFRKAGFVISGQTTDSDLSMWLEVQSKLQMSENINLDDYVDVDTEVVIAEKPTDDDIVASVQQKHSGRSEEDSEDEDKDEGTDLPKTRTFTEVLDSLACLRDYV
uniref:HTH CENPB-type domain-containing protein n=1 Tax=Latimeria chalumnae TaxID=7897 RepID=H3AIV2_LATCH